MNCTIHTNYVYITNNATYGGGKMLNFVPNSNANFSGISNKTIHAFDMIYVGTDYPSPGCTNDNTKLTIQFYCNPYEGNGIPEIVVEKTCENTIKWETAYACRLCVDKTDFIDETTQCQNGKQSIVPKKVNSCNGLVPDPSTSDCASVSVNRSTAFIVGIVAAVIVVILVGIMVYFYCSKRKIENKYKLLVTDNDLDES